jgi:hypothetical protein
MEKLQFRFSQTEDDLIAYNLLFLGNSTTHQRGLRISRLILPGIALCLAAYTMLVRPERLPGTLVISVLAIAWFLWWPAFRQSNALNTIRRMVRERSNEAILGEHVVTIDDQNIRCEYPGGVSEVRWSSIIEVREDERVLLLYLSSIHTLLFPKDRVPAEILDQIRSRAAQQVVARKPTVI